MSQYKVSQGNGSTNNLAFGRLSLSHTKQNTIGSQTTTTQTTPQTNAPEHFQANPIRPDDVLAHVIQGNMEAVQTAVLGYEMVSEPGTAYTIAVSFANGFDLRTNTNIDTAKAILGVLELDSLPVLSEELTEVEAIAALPYIALRRGASTKQATTFLELFETEMNQSYLYEGCDVRAEQYVEKYSWLLSKLGSDPKSIGFVILMAGVRWLRQTGDPERYACFEEKVMNFDVQTSEVFGRVKRCPYFQNFFYRMMDVGESTRDVLMNQDDVMNRIGDLMDGLHGRFEGQMTISLVHFRADTRVIESETKFEAACRVLAPLLQEIDVIDGFKFQRHDDCRDLTLCLTTNFPTEDVIAVLRRDFSDVYCAFVVNKNGDQCWWRAERGTKYCKEHGRQVDAERKAIRSRFPSCFR